MSLNKWLWIAFIVALIPGLALFIGMAASQGIILFLVPVAGVFLLLYGGVILATGGKVGSKLAEAKDSPVRIASGLAAAIVLSLLALLVAFMGLYFGVRAI